MTNQNNIQDELRGLNSNLPVENSQNPFSVPEGYFDGLAATILAKIKEQSTSVANELKELSPLLAGISKQMPYTVPAGYFEQNTEALSGLIKEEESPVLAAIGKEMPYTIPSGYFWSLPEQVLVRVTKQQAKVVPLFARKWMRVAVAAVIGSVMLIGGYQLLNRNEQIKPLVGQHSDSPSQNQQVAKNGSESVVKEIQKLSTEELDEFIKNALVNTAKPQKQSNKPQTKEEVDQLLKDVTVPEIDAFLNQIPTTDEDLQITN